MFCHVVAQLFLLPCVPMPHVPQLLDKANARKEGRPLILLQDGEVVHRLVGYRLRNLRAASGFRETPEQREMTNRTSRFA
jgi:antitoxin (DNA-binding transcriptional repressor) of toxin-antitoxin stability system